MIVRISREVTDPCRIEIPSSKSVSHRMLIAAALAEGESHIYRMAENADTEATLSALTHLGAEIRKTSEGVFIRGTGGTLKYDGEVIDCAESGSTLRFLFPLFLQSGKRCRFTGGGKLLERPMDVYEKLYPVFVRQEGFLEAEGKLKSGEYSIDGSISSQFITGLLFTLPLLEGDSSLNLLPPVESLSYIDMTIDVLRKAGIQVERRGYRIGITGSQKYLPFTGSVPADDSQAAFFAAESLIRKQEVELVGLTHESVQGDRVILKLLEDAGARVEETENGYLVSPAEKTAIEADLSDCPDLGPILFALATQLYGTSRFTGVRRLRIKESDRIAAMQEELEKMGGRMVAGDDFVEISGPLAIRDDVTLYGHNDHRIVMALSMLSSLSEEGITIQGAEAVRKSYPTFFADLAKSGVKIEYLEEMQND